MPRAERSLTVEVPTEREDRPRLGRVGIIAGVAFVLGVLWPWLAGVQLVPSAPVADSSQAGGEAPAKAKAKAQAKAKASVAPLAGEGPAPARVSQPGERVKVGDPTITSCRSPEGKKLSKCDGIDFDGVARPRLQALSGCKALQDARGVLSVGFDLDFQKNAITDYHQGKSTSLPDPTAKQLIACIKQEFSSASLKDIEHDNDHYTVFYLVELVRPEPTDEQAADPEAAGADGVTPASGTATVGWEVALIRKEPKEGEIVARVLSGVRVIVTGRQGDWYRIKYDGKGNEGWVYRAAIGL
jgi:hypothetical protein